MALGGAALLGIYALAEDFVVGILLLFVWFLLSIVVNIVTLGLVARYLGPRTAYAHVWPAALASQLVYFGILILVSQLAALFI